MSDELLVRPANDSDASAIAEFNQLMARETEGKELPNDTVLAGVTRLLAQPEYGFYLVAEESGRVVGSLMVTYEWSDWRNGLYWWIQSVYVKPDRRGRGIYRRMYEFVKARAAQQGNVCGFRLYVDRDNRRARKSYESLGMAETNYTIFEEMPCPD